MKKVNIFFTHFRKWNPYLIYTEQKCIFAPIFHELNSKIEDFFYVHKRPISLKYCSQICVSEHFSFVGIIHPPHRCGISRCWLDSMIIAQVCLRLATIKGHSKMCSFITQHNATDVASFEGAYNWHADCRNVHQSCCPWIEGSFLYHKPSPNAFQRIWQYIQPASKPQTTCNHTSPGQPHPASSPLRSSETSHPDSCCKNQFA